MNVKDFIKNISKENGEYFSQFTDEEIFNMALSEDAYNQIKNNLKLIALLSRIFKSDEYRLKFIFDERIYSYVNDEAVAFYITSLDSDDLKLQLISDKKLYKKVKPFLGYFIGELNSDDIRLKMLFNIKIYPFLKASDIGHIVACIKSDSLKEKTLFDIRVFPRLSGSDLGLIIANLKDDKLKIKLFYDKRIYSRLTLDYDGILYFLAYLTDFDVAKQFIFDENVYPKISGMLYNALYVIKDDNLKLQLLFDEKLMGLLSNWATIISSIKSDELKAKVIFDERMYPKLKYSFEEIIASMGSDEAKIKLLFDERIFANVNVYKVISALECLAISSNAKRVAFNDNNGYYVGLFDDDYNVIEYKYVNNDEIENYPNVNMSSNLDYEKIYQFCLNKENLNPHLVNPIYIKKIGVEK